VTKHSNTWVYFVQILIRLFCDVNTLKKLSLKVLHSVCKSHALSYPLSWETSSTLSGYKSGTPNPWGDSASLTSLAYIDLGDISSGWTKWRMLTREHNWAWKYLASILPLFDVYFSLVARKAIFPVLANFWFPRPLLEKEIYVYTRTSSPRYPTQPSTYLIAWENQVQQTKKPTRYVCVSDVIELLPVWPRRHTNQKPKKYKVTVSLTLAPTCPNLSHLVDDDDCFYYFQK